MPHIPDPRAHAGRRATPRLAGVRATLRLAIVATLAIAALALGPLLASGGAQEREGAARSAVLVTIDGAIGPATTEYLATALERAAERGAAAVILEIDTPGGLSSSTRDIVRMILESAVPVIVYVAPSGARAASAGTYIVYASALAAMAPGTNLGAATPIQLGGGGPLPGGDEGPAGENGEAEDDAPAGQPSGAAGAKAVNDAVAFLRSLAELHDRDAGFAEAAVREAESLSATAALDRGVVEIVAPSLDELLEAADGRTVRVGDGTVTLATADLAVETVEPGWRAELLAAIANPNVAYILMLIGIYGIIFEFASPGTIFPGVIGAISLLVGLFALNLVGIDYVGAGLALLGIALMVAEAFAPSFGILGIGGAIAFALGSVFMFEDAPGFALSWPVVIGATAVTAGLLAVVLAIVVRAQRRRSVSGGDAIVGSLGEVVDWSGEEGEVRLHGELWRARSSAALEPGDRVEITARDSLILTVEPAGERRAS